MLCNEVTAVYLKAYKKINALCGNIAEFLNVKVECTQNNHYA